MADVEVDVIGLLCPLPVLKARKVLASMEVGQVLRILASDAMAQIDMPVFCREAGHEFLGMEEVDRGQAYLIRRG
ncbi:MAG: sulfurtransferase TusA family protein [Marivivens sp.]|jgi:tRNA 2-thiouridine synthesizing protein A|uniref:sulfurtransferase TusA family protein n=1 Tax=Marivivens sp. TaxID=1978374 RepID=UPI00201EB864|nr:sulfurtransferase TusA family protein [Marivivens sp.]MCL7406299.1 sulfurtransferase TusA family protein [Marivivens geojensis]NBQ51808.1 sulfurtransferase TusA family protein [Marivivens sp.]NBT51856.1 sulfurtransferase TusA family protein [Marivivens sp.]NBX09503.1 sulfurtransferase TusA family protein [Marivivens sp.]NCW69150.1 sulfurtransferase TusA family protein [Marivivens sp.]